MTRTHFGRTSFTWLLSILLAASLAPSASAQSDSPEEPSWMLLSEIQVKPEMRQEWHDLQKSEVSPAFKKAGVAHRSVWETVVGDVRTYYSVVELEKLADLDEGGPLKRALTPEKRIVLLQKLSKCIDGRKRSVIRARPDLSIPGAEGSMGRLAVVVEVSVIPGKQKAFEQLMKAEVLPALEKGGVQQFLVSQMAFGGNRYVYAFLSMLPDFAEIDKGSPLVRALGPEGAQKLAEKLGGLTSSVNYSIVRLNLELSFGP